MIARSLTIIASALLASGANAATTPVTPATAHPAAAVHPAAAHPAAKPAAAPAHPAATAAAPAKPSMFSRLTSAMKPKPAATPAAKPAVHHASATMNGRMVTTKTSTGKTITYNCSKQGNANKKACS